MKSIIFLLIFLSFTLLGTAEKVALLTDVLNPETIHCDGNRIYFTEQANIYIYTLKDYKLLKKFGKKGEGPREFKVDPLMGGLQIDVNSEYILANTIGRIHFFTKDGIYIKEIKIPVRFVLCKKMGANFVTMNFQQINEGNFTKINIYDSELKNKTELFKAKHFFQQGKKFNPLARPPMFWVVDKKIEVDDSEKIYVFDDKAKLLLSKEIEREKHPLSKEDEKNIIEYYQKDPKYRAYWGYFKQLLDIPSHFPAIRYCIANNGKIYVRTFTENDDKSELRIYDMKGTLLKTTFIKILDKSLVEHYPYTISNDTLYQTVWNDDEEIWELHATAVK